MFYWKKIKLYLTLTFLGLIFCNHDILGNESDEFCSSLANITQAPSNNLSYQPNTVNLLGSFCNTTTSSMNLSSGINSFDYSYLPSTIDSQGNEELDEEALRVKIDNINFLLSETTKEVQDGLKSNEFSKAFVGNVVGTVGGAFAAATIPTCTVGAGAAATGVGAVPGAGLCLGGAATGVASGIIGGIGAAVYTTYVWEDNSEEIKNWGKEKKEEIIRRGIGSIADETLRGQILNALTARSDINPGGCALEGGDPPIVNCPDLDFDEVIEAIVADLDPEMQTMARSMLGDSFQKSGLKVIAERMIAGDQEMENKIDQLRGDLGNDISANRTVLNNHAKRLTEIDSHLKRHDEQIKQLQIDLQEFQDEVKKRFSDLEDQLEDTNRRVSRNTEGIEDNAQNIFENRELINKNREDINSISSDLGFMTEWMLGQMTSKERLQALQSDLFPCRQQDPSLKNACETNREQLLAKTKLQIKKEKLIESFKNVQESISALGEVTTLLHNMGFLNDKQAQVLGKGLQAASIVTQGILTMMAPPGNPMGLIQMFNGLFSLFSPPKPDIVQLKLDRIMENQQRILKGIDIIITNQNRLFDGQRKIMNTLTSFYKTYKKDMANIKLLMGEIHGSILINRRLLTVEIEEDLIACERFLYKFDLDNNIIGVHLGSFGTYEDMRRRASDNDNYNTCRRNLINLLTTDYEMDLMTDPSIASVTGASSTGLVNNQNQVESLRNHIINPQFNVLSKLLENSELPFFTSKNYPNFCKGNNIKVGDVWEIQEDTAYENCLKAPTCQQATRTCEGRDEETCQETASPCEFMDNEERWDRLWVMLKKPSEKLDFLYEKTHMNVRNDFQPKEWGEVGEEDEESREETIKNQIKKARSYESLFRWIDITFDIEPWMDLGNRNIDASGLIPIEEIHTNPSRQEENRHKVFYSKLLKIINLSIAHEAFLSGDILIPHLYERLKTINWRKKHSFIKRMIKMALKTGETENRHLLQLCNLDASNYGCFGRTASDDGSEVGVGDEGFEGENCDGDTRRTYDPDLDKLIKSDLALAINGACLLKTNPILAENFVKYLMIQELNKKEHSLISYQIAMMATKTKTPLLEGITENPWEFWYKDGYGAHHIHGQIPPGWYIKFGDEINLKLPSPESLNKPIFRLSSSYYNLMDYRKRLIEALSRIELMNKITGDEINFNNETRALIYSGMVMDSSLKSKESQMRKDFITECYKGESQSGEPFCSVPTDDCLISNNGFCAVRGCQTWNENALLENPKCWFLSDTEERIRSCYTSASNEGVPFCAEFETDAEKNCLIKGEPNPDGTVNCEVFRCKSWNYNDVSEECKNFAWLNETIFEEAQ